jgi:ABC-2 type transport system permease protein
VTLVEPATPMTDAIAAVQSRAPIPGPSALGTDSRRLAHLTWTLAVTDFKLRFFGSVLGYLWQLMRPLMLFGVLYLVFSLFIDATAGLPLFPVALLLGIVLFQFFGEATSNSVRSVLVREGLIRRVEFPRLAIPLATVLTATFNLGLNLIPVFVFLIFSGGSPMLTWLELPFILAMLIALALGLAMMLSALFVRYRDVEPIWDVVMQALFYVTPILYSIQLVIDKAGIDVARIIMLNPFATVVQQARHAVVDEAYVSTGQVLGSPLWVAVPIALTGIILVVGWLVFQRAAPRLAEEI